MAPTAVVKTLERMYAETDDHLVTSPKYACAYDRRSSLFETAKGSLHLDMYIEEVHGTLDAPYPRRVPPPHRRMMAESVGRLPLAALRPAGDRISAS